MDKYAINMDDYKLLLDEMNFILAISVGAMVKPNTVTGSIIEPIENGEEDVLIIDCDNDIKAADICDILRQIGLKREYDKDDLRIYGKSRGTWEKIKWVDKPEDEDNCYENFHEILQKTNENEQETTDNSGDTKQ